MNIFDGIADRRRKESSDKQAKEKKRTAECNLASHIVVPILKELKRSKVSHWDFIPFLDFVCFDKDDYEWSLGGAVNVKITIRARFNDENEFDGFKVVRLDDYRGVYETVLCNKVDKSSLEKAILKVYADK